MVQVEIRNQGGFTNGVIAGRWREHLGSEDPFRETENGTYDQIRRWCHEAGLGSNAHLIDGGCGQGVSSEVALEALPDGARVTGVDFSPPLIKMALSNHLQPSNLDFLVADVSQLPFPPNWFSGGMLINCLFHLSPETMIQTMREFKRTVRPRSPILITTVNPDANEMFAEAFLNQTRFEVGMKELPEKTIIVLGHPKVAGPHGSEIILKNEAKPDIKVPFVMYSLANLERAFEMAKLEIESLSTFGPLTLVDGPELDLFTAIKLKT